MISGLEMITVSVMRTATTRMRHKTSANVNVRVMDGVMANVRARVSVRVVLQHALFPQYRDW
jgi:hypothetical protein